MQSHSRNKADNVGGNGFAIHDSDLNASDFTITLSYKKNEGADGTYHVFRCSYLITRYNVTDSYDGTLGSGCGDIWTPTQDSFVSYANLMRDGGYMTFTVNIGGYFYSEFLNILNNTDVGSCFIYTDNSYMEFRNCCLFKNTAQSCYGSFKLVGCLTNLAYNGAIVTSETFYRFDFDYNCIVLKSKFFTLKKEQLITYALQIFSLFACGLGMTQ